MGHCVERRWRSRFSTGLRFARFTLPSRANARTTPEPITLGAELAWMARLRDLWAQWIGAPLF
jgi:hypothetical protein